MKKKEKNLILFLNEDDLAKLYRGESVEMEAHDRWSAIAFDLRLEDRIIRRTAEQQTRIASDL